MIQTAAVEAATDALQQFALAEDRDGLQAWDAYARVALEAAAPHMLAEAFDAGQKSGMRHTDRLVAAAKIGRPELPGPLSPNPYRK